MKPSNKIRRREARANRRLEYGAARAAFLLAGGHKDWIVPFHVNWRHAFAAMTYSLELGQTTYSQPRNRRYDYFGTTTARYHSGTIDYYQTAYRK